MNLLKIPQGTPVIIDSNILLFANHKISLQCIKLLERCAGNEVLGVLPTNILSEVMHLLLLAEIKDLGRIQDTNIEKSLVEDPKNVMYLSRYESLMRDLLAGGLQIEPLQREDFITALSFQRQHGLLTNDALFLAVALRLGIKDIVTSKTVFNAVPGIICYSPNDLNEELI